jgi:Exocyst complex subunit Sec15-like.
MLVSNALREDRLNDQTGSTARARGEEHQPSRSDCTGKRCGISSAIRGQSECPYSARNLDELQQTVQLMQADNADEFYDVSTRNKKYGRVDAMQGPLLLESMAFSE